MGNESTIHTTVSNLDLSFITLTTGVAGSITKNFFQMSKVLRQSISGRNVLDEKRKVPPEVLQLQRVQEVVGLQHCGRRAERRDILQLVLWEAVWGARDVQSDGGQVDQDGAHQTELVFV